MLRFLIILMLVTINISLFAQKSPEKVGAKLGQNPLFFLDSISITREEMSKFNPNNLASLTLFEGKEAVLTLGDKAKDGAVYLESIPFAKKRFHRYFKTKSREFENLVPNLESDTSVQYILNGKVLKQNQVGDLSSIDDKIFQEIKIISKDGLIKNYGITDKLIGVFIRSKVPENLYNGKKKF